MKLAFVSGLSDKKLAQKLAPLQALPEVLVIDLYRRRPFSGEKILWMRMPRFFSWFYPLGDLWRFISLLKNARRYDVMIGCHQRYHGVYAALAGFLFGKKVVQLIISDPVWMQKSFMGGWALRHASAIGFRGQNTLKRFRDILGSEKILFVPHNVWYAPKSIRQADKSIDLLYVGYLAGYKNIPAWLQTAAEVKRRCGKLHVVMVGEEPGRKIMALIKSLGLWNNIEFTGHLSGDDLDRRYAEARVLLLTSFWEGLPMVALEAMAVGVPVVATDVGDTRDLVKDGENGYLTKPGDIEGAADAVERLLNDHELWCHMSDNALKSADALIAESTLERVQGEWRRVFIDLGLI